MMDLRSYQSGDEQALVALWNRRVAGCYATAPLTPDAFRTEVVGKRHFEPDGLWLAFRQGRLAAWAHAGFRASDSEAPDLQLGTVAMLAAEQGECEAGQAVVAAAVRYLRAKGASEIRTFTIDFPNTPFYNGLYGGEKAGMDERHPLGQEIFKAAGFVLAAEAIIMTCEFKNPVEPPALPAGARLSVVPWESAFTRPGAAQAYGIPEPIRQAEILDESGKVLAHLVFWHLDRYNRVTGARIAVVSHVWAPVEARGTGVAACLQQSVHHLLHREGAREMGLGVAAGNARAIRFYEKMGYRALRKAFQFSLEPSTRKP